ncbi:Oidioi.mRNA.OKI2018_I69.XSR.g15664.t1.cds [Oikopleura dioica]|uniref:Oidioi.mRNA.OKI2018_I69.XSR.g15664.t1.cds n=1 Tax=Oikopleura dioica TaxID=34765 RepID=A0ABN7SIN9_OIKDI|nr:Oidioi.mRNA.OKI2018_I69.XSR.g15664.t1.cds [Oikopleura dioica]
MTDELTIEENKFLKNLTCPYLSELKKRKDDREKNAPFFLEAFDAQGKPWSKKENQLAQKHYLKECFDCFEQVDSCLLIGFYILGAIGIIFRQLVNGE